MKIESDFALLDVKAGRGKLFNHFGTENSKDQNPEKIPVVIYGEISCVWGSDDGISREFEVEVKAVHIDHAGEAR